MPFDVFSTPSAITAKESVMVLNLWPAEGCRTVLATATLQIQKHHQTIQLAEVQVRQQQTI